MKSMMKDFHIHRRIYRVWYSLKMSSDINIVLYIIFLYYIYSK